MANLISLSEYKEYVGISSTDTRDDTRITALLPAVSRTISLYTGRSFDVSTGTASTRSYQYDGSGILDIDDCSAVTALSTDGGTPGQSYSLLSEQWVLMPQDDSDVFYYLLLLGGPYLGSSPEMGFERNLDTMDMWFRQPIISVTATWGWPSVPPDVKLAASMILSDLLARKGNTSEGVTAEAIEGFSRSWAGRTGPSAALTIPNRARDILAGYQRIMV
jgi:hypothetical protein